MARKYRKPPIVEAVCEFRIPSAVAWDGTILGHVYDQLKNEFPVKDKRLLTEVKITAKPNEGVEKDILTRELTMFLTDDRKRFIQVGERLFATNCVEQYPTWSVFSRTIGRTFKVMTQEVAIERFERIGLRYINKIEIPDRPFDPEGCFTLGPFLGNVIQPLERIRKFQISSEVACRDSDTCRLTLRTVPPDVEGCIAFILDLDYFPVQPGILLRDQAIPWIEDAHKEIEAIFEGCITDRLRELFDEVK